MVRVLVAFARSRMGLWSVPCIQFGPLQIAGGLAYFAVEKGRNRGPTDQLNDQVHHFGKATVVSNAPFLHQQQATYASAHTMTSFQYSDFHSMLEQDSRTSQTSNAGADYTDVRYLTRCSSNHRRLCLAYVLHVVVLMRRGGKIALNSGLARALWRWPTRWNVSLSFAFQVTIVTHIGTNENGDCEGMDDWIDEALLKPKTRIVTSVANDACFERFWDSRKCGALLEPPRSTMQAV
jgi:hypothetical protein